MIENKFQSLMMFSPYPAGMQTSSPDSPPALRGKADDFERVLDYSAKKTMEKSPAKRSEINDLITKYSEKNNLDEDLVRALINQESGFNPNATSKAGAMGLMQLMPSTAHGLGVTDAYDIEQNIEGGTKYLRGLLDRFDNDKSLALAAYNAGPNAVKKYGGIPPYAETQNYVKKVLSNYDNYRGAN